VRRELTHLLLPRLEQRIHAIDVELRQRHVVPRAVADHSRHAGCRTVPVDARGDVSARGAAVPTQGWSLSNTNVPV
jgi:hypothetical protein